MSKTSFTPDVHKITEAIDAAIAQVQAAQAAAIRANNTLKDDSLRAMNEEALMDARRQLAAFQAAKSAVAANCCSNFQDCPIDVYES